MCLWYPSVMREILANSAWQKHCYLVIYYYLLKGRGKRIFWITRPVFPSKARKYGAMLPKNPARQGLRRSTLFALNFCVIFVLFCLWNMPSLTVWAKAVYWSNAVWGNRYEEGGKSRREKLEYWFNIINQL